MKISLELEPCLKNKSGIGIYTYELAKKLQNYQDVELLGNVFNFLNRKDISKDMSGLNFDKNICRIMPYGIYRRIWHYVPIRYNQLFKKQVDIHHFFNFIVPPKVEGKVINCIHDLTFLFYPETMDAKNLKRITSDIQYSIDRSDKIITISESTKRDLINKLKITPDKIEIIYPAVEYEMFNKSYETTKVLKVRQKYNLPKNYILYMGTLEPRKNIESIIAAFSLLKQQKDIDLTSIKLVIAGKKGWLFEEIFEQIKLLGLQKEVIFTDYVEEVDKPIIYQQASLFTFPSLYEGFGIPILEAMAASVPVITSNVSSLPEVGGDAAILVDPKDIEAICKNMIKILLDSEYCEKMIIKGHNQAKKFTWEESANKLYKVYKKILYN